MVEQQAPRDAREEGVKGAYLVDRVAGATRLTRGPCKTLDLGGGKSPGAAAGDDGGAANPLLRRLVMREEGGGRWCDGVARDRKSTRLNSSHAD